MTTTLGQIVDTLRLAGVRRFSIELEPTFTGATGEATKAADVPPAKAPEPPRAVREMDEMERGMLDERERKRRLARAQAESDNLLFSASCGWNPPSLFIEGADDAAA